MGLSAVTTGLRAVYAQSYGSESIGRGAALSARRLIRCQQQIKNSAGIAAGLLGICGQFILGSVEPDAIHIRLQGLPDCRGPILINQWPQVMSKMAGHARTVEPLQPCKRRCIGGSGPKLHPNAAFFRCKQLIIKIRIQGGVKPVLWGICCG